jgi:hypothetical protein
MVLCRCIQPASGSVFVHKVKVIRPLPISKRLPFLFIARFQPSQLHSHPIYTPIHIPFVSSHQLEALTTPFPPSRPTVPSLNSSLLSISPSSTPLSLSTSTCLNVTTSRKLLPCAPLLPIDSNSFSASSANLYRAVSKLTAGFEAVEGKMVCEGAEDEGWKCEVVDGWAEGGELKVEEFDCVGFGWTGPSCWRRALRARSGSEASRFISLNCRIY